MNTKTFVVRPGVYTLEEIHAELDRMFNQFFSNKTHHVEILSVKDTVFHDGVPTHFTRCVVYKIK